MKAYKFYSYDVWCEYVPGEGKHYQVNDVYSSDLVLLLDVEKCKTNAELSREIRNALNPKSRMRYHLEGESDYTLYVERERDWYPLFELRAMSDEEVDEILGGNYRHWNVCMSKETSKKIVRRAKA